MDSWRPKQLQQSCSSAVTRHKASTISASMTLEDFYPARLGWSHRGLNAACCKLAHETAAIALPKQQ